MRDDKESLHGTKQSMIPGDTTDSSLGAHNPDPDQNQRSWEAWTTGRAETDRPIFNEKDFPVLTAEKKKNSNVSDALTKISNKLGPKEDPKGPSSGVQKPVDPKKEYHPCDPSNPEFDVSKYYSPFGNTWICPWLGCK
jgi:hypothetical protein